MKKYNYVKQYVSNNELLNSYHDFTQQIFSFDLSTWKEKGYWGNNYIPHSFVLNGKVIANISACIMNIQLKGNHLKSIQLGSVGVLEDFRGNGFARILMEKVKEEYKDFPLIFLFASEDVSKFYTKLGFKRVDEITPFFKVENDNSYRIAEKLSLESNILKELVQAKANYSSILDARNNPDIYWFHLLYRYKNDIYYIKEYNTIFIAKYNNNLVKLNDILTDRDISFNDIINYIAKKDSKLVEFYFTPDWLKINYSTKPYNKNALYVYGPLSDMIKGNRFPTTSST